MAHRCHVCCGYKKMIGLGNLETTCTNCDGTGYVSDKEEDEVEEEIQETLVRRRGRPRIDK